MYFEQIHRIHYIPTLPSLLSPFQTVCGGFDYAVFIGLCVMYFNPFQISLSFSFPVFLLIPS
jgi:hypothetical protein